MDAKTYFIVQLVTTVTNNFLQLLYVNILKIVKCNGFIFWANSVVCTIFVCLLGFIQMLLVLRTGIVVVIRKSYVCQHNP